MGVFVHNGNAVIFPDTEIHQGMGELPDPSGKALIVHSQTPADHRLFFGVEPHGFGKELIQ